jgi:hypothetical protein
MEKIRFEGVVTEVRTFREKVFLFVRCRRPKKVKDRIVKFVLSKDNCDEALLDLAAGLCIGATAIIEKDSRCEHKYFYVDALNDAVSASVI